MAHKPEVAMEAETDQESRTVGAIKTCAHKRVIDDVLSEGGKRTGKVRCLECHAEFTDPYSARNKNMMTR